MTRAVFILIAILFLSNARAEDRELLLSTWEPERWSLYDTGKIENTAAKSPDGEPLSRITLSPADIPQAALTQINLPATATTLKMFIHKTELGSSKHLALFQDSHGWGGGGKTEWAFKEDGTYSTPAMNAQTPGWSWRVGFFKARLDAPIRFRGFEFQSRDPKDSQGKPTTIEAGPVRVAYAPDDAQWLYTDLQPKTISSRDGEIPPLTLRVANLGTQARSFKLSAQPIQRNLKELKEDALSLGEITLAPGELKSIPIKLALHLLGRYVIEYRAEIAGVLTTQQEPLSVINAFDVAEGFRHWTAQRKWFSVPDRRPGSDDAGKAKLNIAAANNGLGPVPLFPVMARNPRETISPYDLKVDADHPLSVLTTQLSPAWLFHCAMPQVQLFGETIPFGLAPPSHLAFATAKGTRVLKYGTSLDAKELQEMTEPWLLAWWQGSDGWRVFDAPVLVVLERRPHGLKLAANGVELSFDGAARHFITMPLYGYAKLPQQLAQQKQPEIFKFPPAWNAADLQTWTWESALPIGIRARCTWWSQTLIRFPYDVSESFHVDHAKGSVEVLDTFSYLELKTEWNTPGVQLAPLSPTLALAQRSGFPITVNGETIDLNYPTLYGPYTARVGTNEIRYSLNIGPWLMHAADPNLARPADTTTPARRAQADVLNAALANSSDREYQMWDWKDENFVWYAQANDNRIPSLLTAYTSGGLRQDRKFWLQARTLHTLLASDRYKIDERGGSLTRRYIDGPGIGNWGSLDWGDSGKLGTDMIYDAYTYAYNTGDYQTIADNWDLLVSLNTSSSTMSWLGVGRASIAELGDEAPPMLALARLAYAVGDRETYSAAASWYARELVHHHGKEGAFTKWQEQFSPWHEARLLLPTETVTNTWGNNAAWMGGGFHSPEKGENQWDNFYVRFDDLDTLRFHREHAKEMPARVMSAATVEERKNNPKLYFARVGVLAEDPAKAQDEFFDAAKKDARRLPDTHTARVITALSEFPPKLEPLIPADAPPSADKGFAWDQMNNFDPALVNPSGMAKNRLPTMLWFHWQPPLPVKSKLEGSNQWTFGSISPGPTYIPGPPLKKPLNAVTTSFTFPAGK